MPLFLPLFLSLLLTSTGARPRQAADATGLIAIMGATVVDGTGAAPEQRNILVRGDRIEAVGAKIEAPPGARVIDARGQTVIPGLFDLHTHLPYASGSSQTGDWPKNLKAYLYCGVTTVVDFGTYGETFEPMRRLIRTGVVEAPRIHYAVRMTTPGGHGAEGGRGDLFSLEVSTANEARAAVRSSLRFQPDVIKVFTDGWRYGNAPDMSSMNQETLSALVDEAHKNGLEVLTHTVTLEKAKIAARAGVDVIAHGIGNARVDEEVIRLMKANGTTYAPTLAVYEPRTREILSPLLKTVLDASVLAAITPPLIAPGTTGEAPRTTPRWQNLQANTAALRQGGVRFGVGTDAGVVGTHHGWATLRELQLLAANGLTPLEAITAATGNAAQALHVDNERGTIAPGKQADLILIAGEPHKKISEIENIRRVFLRGREIDREKLASEIATMTPTPIPAIRATERIDDFESVNERTLLDTRIVNGTDAGVDHTQMLFGRILREANDHALSITARMAHKERPFARLSVPLSRGGVEPVDAREFRGIAFEARGDGEYRLSIPTSRVRDHDHFQALFQATAKWQTVTIEFSSLRQPARRRPVPWSGDDLFMINFDIARAAGAFGWLELDNLRFVK
ncbi:MAG: CIA30 family protein [Blastocatellia bacterium]|nr:CIA30 family protein [Blastocatellia bacterium]